MNHFNFKNQLKNSFETQKKCDVWFDFWTDKSVMRMGAHKLILSLSSDVFETMFFGECAKGDIFENGTCIQIADIKGEIFKLFLR